MQGLISLLIALSVGAVFVFSGVLLKALGSSGKSRNPVAGYRTPRSMKSPESWIAANHYAAKCFTVAGIVIIFSGVCLWWKPLPQSYNEIIILVITIAGIAISLVATESYLKRHFNRDGRPQTGQPVSDEKPSPRTEAEVKGSGKIPFSRLDYLLEIASLSGIILGIFLLIYFWPQLPEQVPRHFNFQGAVDSWGDKRITLIFPTLNVLFNISLSVIRFFTPVFFLAQERAEQRTLRLSLDLIALLKTWTARFFTCFLWATLEIALGRTAALPPLFIPLALGINLAIIATYTALILREAKSR
ncbi:MAG TPA: DUF1648 domain-containing protein [Firmicutes bacterium]|nr:DUF1648 domain-containing protein [Bacillota bacterium]